MSTKLQCVTQTVNQTIKVDKCSVILNNYEPLYMLALIAVSIPFIVFLYFRLTAKVIDKYEDFGGVTWNEEE